MLENATLLDSVPTDIGILVLRFEISRPDAHRILSRPIQIETDRFHANLGIEERWALGFPCGTEIVIRLNVNKGDAAVFAAPADIQKVVRYLRPLLDGRKFQIEQNE